MNLLKERYNYYSPFDKFEVRRVVVYETDISKYL